MSLANLDLTVVLQQASIDASSVLFIFNITFIVLLVLAALIGLIRGVWRAGFRFLFVLTALVALWFLSPGIIESLMDYPVKGLLEPIGWEVETLRELPNYLAQNGDFTDDLKAIFSNQDIQELLLGLLQAILTFVVFFIGGVLIILLSWPLSTLLYAFVRYAIPKKWRKERKLRPVGALIGVIQALVSFSVLLMPFSVVNNALSNIDRKNLEGNKEILTIYDLGRVYGDSFAGQLFSVFALPFSNGAKAQLWASDQLLTMKFKSNSIVLTDEIDVFMNVFDELLKAGAVDIVFEADAGLTVYFNTNIGNLKLPSGAIDVANKATFDPFTFDGNLGSSYYEYLASHGKFNPYLWDYNAINNQFNLPYFENGYVYQGGEFVLDPTYQMITYLQSLGFEFDPGKLDVPTLTAYIETYLPHVNLGDPTTWGLDREYSVSSRYEVEVLQKIIDVNLPKMSSVPLVLDPNFGTFPYYAFNLNNTFDLGSTGSLAAIIAANLPYININFSDWKINVSTGSFGNIALPNEGSVNLDNSKLEDLLDILSPELVKDILNLISDSDLIVNTLPVALDIALVLPSLEEYFDASKINPSDLELTSEEWAAELQQIGEVASRIIELDVIRDVLNNNKEYFGYDPNKVQELGFEFAKLKLATQILPAALPAVLPNVVDVEYYEGLGLDSVDFSKYNWEQEFQKISIMAANALKLDLEGIVDQDIDYFTQDSEAVSNILNALTESQVIMDIIPNAIDYALTLDVVKEYTKDVEINLPEVDWATEIRDLGRVYTEIAKVGGDPRDVKWGLTDEETEAKVAAIEAAIDILFKSQLINGLLPTLAEIGVNYLEAPYNEAVDPDLIDFEDLNLSEEVKNAFRVYRLIIDEDGELNDKILTYSDDKIRQIADFIGNSDIVVPLLPNAINVLGKHFEVDKYIDLDTELFEDVNWADTIYNLVGVGKYFVDEENNPKVDIVNLTDENILDIATRLDNTELVNRLLPSAVKKILTIYEYDKYYKEDMLDYENLSVGTEISYFLRVLRALNFEFDIETQDFNLNLDFKTYDEDMISLIESELNASTLLKDLYPVMLEIVQDNLPDDYKDLIDLSNLKIENLGSEIANILRVLNVVGGNVDIGKGKISLNLDFTTYTDPMIDKITNSLRGSKLLDDLFRLLLDTFENIIYEQTEIEIDLDEYVTDDIIIGEEIGNIIRIAREVELKINEDFTLGTYNIKVATYSDDQINKLAAAVGSSKLVKNILPAAVDIAKDYVPDPYVKLIDKDAYDFDLVDLEIDLSKLLKAARLFLNEDNEIVPRFYDLTDAEIELVADAIASSTLIKMVINPTIDKLVEHSKDILGLDINEYVDLRVIEDYTAIDLQNEFDSLLRIARSLVATNPESLEYPYTVKFNTTEEERIEVANALNKMTLIDELLPSLFEKVSNLDMVKGYIDLTKVNLDNVRIGDEVKGVLELLDLVSEDYFNLTMELEVVNKPGVIDLAVKVINESVLIKEVASVAFDMVFDNQDLIDKGIDLNKYLSRDVLDFETINLGDEIKPFLLVLSSLVEKGNQIDINLDITPEEYAEIELAFANTTILPTIIKDVKNNLPEILDGIKDGLSSTIVDFFDFDAYDLEDLDWGKELTNFVKIGVAVVDMTDKGNYELDLELTDDEIELIAEAINNSEIFIRAVETALTTIINNTDLYEKFLKGVELIDYYDPSKLNLRETGKLGNDIAQLLKVAREFVTDGLKFELKLSEISEETYDVIAQSVNNLEILRHVLETLLTRPYRITYKNIKINSTDYITFDDYFTDYQFGEDFVRLLKVATVFVSDNYKFELKTKFSADEVDLISSNLGNLKLLNMIIDKGVNAVAKYFELDEELVDKADLANLDLESELYQLLRVVNALEVDINDPISMLNLTEDQYEEIGEAIGEMKLIKGLVPLAAGIALSYYSDFEFVNEIDINEINFDNIDFGDEVIRIFKIIEQVDFKIINKDGAISFSYNNVINSYTHEQIDIIAEQIGGSNLVKELLPIGARIGVCYIPAEYRDLVNLDDVDFDELDLTVELTNIAKAAILFFNDNNVLTIRIDTLSADEIATIAKVGSSKLISMVINHAVYTFADKSSDILGKFGLKLDINEYVDLKSIDYSAIDLEGELVSILTIARQVVVVKDNKFDYRLDLNTDQIALIEENINKLDLVKQLLESAINVMSTHKFVEPYVDLTELDINSFDLGKELGRFLEIASAISGADGKLVLALELIKDDALVDLVVNVLNDSEILKALAPSAIDKVFDNEMLLNSGIKLSDYLDRNAIDVSEVKWGDELRPALYAFGALIVVDNTVRLTLDFEESDYAKIADAFNKSTLIPQLVTNAQANVQYVINRYSEGDLYQFITNFIDIDGLDLVDGINWGDELVGILKVVKGIVGFVDDGGIKVSIDLQLDVEDVEAIREFINGSELIVRIAENALDTTINNPEILGMFISPLKGTTISEYHDFADLDFRTTHKLGDEIANILYVARHFVNDQNQIVLDLDNIDEVVYEEIETNINKSKLIPYLIDTAARVAVENLGVRIEDVDLMVKHYIDLSDVDFYSIEYGSEIAKLLKSAMVFKVPGEYKIGLKLSFTEDEVLTIADNLGTSELLELALRKGIIGGLKLFGLDKDITIEDIKFDELVIRDELYHLLSVVRILNLDINNI
ncbi:TPA: hypothetical protein GXZ54_04860, partial [bacterium]|nr:hypothetical protein [bacterium]